jgi:hypothetical protein
MLFPAELFQTPSRDRFQCRALKNAAVTLSAGNTCGFRALDAPEIEVQLEACGTRTSGLGRLGSRRVRVRIVVKEAKGTDRGGRAGENNSSSRSKAPRPRKIPDSEANDALRQEIAAHAATRAELARVRAEARLASRECDELKSRVEMAFRGAGIHAFAQDRDLRYTWVSGPRGADPSMLLGRTEDELWSSPEQQSVVALKRRVLETGKAEDCEVSYITPEFALRGSNVAVFTQDKDLRYTSVSKPVRSTPIAHITRRQAKHWPAPTGHGPTG